MILLVELYVSPTRKTSKIVPIEAFQTSPTQVSRRVSALPCSATIRRQPGAEEYLHAFSGIIGVAAARSTAT